MMLDRLLTLAVTYPEVTIPVALVLARLLLQAIARTAAGRAPLVADLAARGADAAASAGPVLHEILKALKGRGPVAQSLPPPPRSDDDDDTPVGPKAPPKIVIFTLVVLWVTACLGLAGCGMSPVSSAIVVANASRDAGEVAREELETRCVEGYRAAGDIATVARLDEVCLPLRDAYRGLRGAHLALVTAIQVAQARGDLGALLPAVAATVEASEIVARAVAGGAR